MDEKAELILRTLCTKPVKIDAQGMPIYRGKDYSYAKAQGVMFAPQKLTHNKLINRLTTAAKQVSQEDVVIGFLSGLSTRTIRWRSLLSSFMIANNLKPHSFKPAGAGLASPCVICNKSGWMHTGQEFMVDWNRFNYERLNFGGLQQASPYFALAYALFDLELYLREKPEFSLPNQNDAEILRAIITAITSCQADDGPRQLSDALTGILPSNKTERDSLVLTLYGAEIIKETFPRASRAGTTTSWGKAGAWRGEDGYDKQIIKKLFSEILELN